MIGWLFRKVWGLVRRLVGWKDKDEIMFDLIDPDLVPSKGKVVSPAKLLTHSPRGRQKRKGMSKVEKARFAIRNTEQAMEDTQKYRHAGVYTQAEYQSMMKTHKEDLEHWKKRLAEAERKAK